MKTLECKQCSNTYQTKSTRSMYCSSSCKEDSRKGPCLGGCGRMRFKRRGELVTCHDCRKDNSCGSRSGYRNGCRCDDCKAAVNEAKKTFTAKYYEKHGVSYRWRHGRTERDGGIPISRADRIAIYERDGWVCQLCMGAIDPHEGEFRLRASLDHITPQSWEEEPDHSPSNLRLAHVGCNARRKDAVHESLYVKESANG